MTAGCRPAAGLKPLRGEPGAERAARRRRRRDGGPDASLVLADLSNGIDALMEAELSSVLERIEAAAEPRDRTGRGRRSRPNGRRATGG